LTLTTPFGGVPVVFDENLLTPLSTWRHVATDSTYTVLGVAACSTNGRDGETSVVYCSHTYQGLRYREVGEFLDGRFEPVAKKDLQ
jgi:hypothetical protein